MDSPSSPTVAQMVLEAPASAAVFQRHRIDFCCAGNQTLEAACAERGLEVAVVRGEIEAARGERAASPPGDPRLLSTRELLERIVGKHHGYLRRALPAVVPLAAKIARVHGGREPKLLQLVTAVRELAETLEPHIDEEEQVLFPALAEGRAATSDLRQMVVEHRTVAAILDRIHDASDGFRVPSWGCASYRALASELRALDADVRAHVHLENHVLLPRFLSGSGEAVIGS